MEAINGIIKHLVKQSYPNKLTFVGELLSGRSYSPKMVCNIFFLFKKFFHVINVVQTH